MIQLRWLSPPGLFSPPPLAKEAAPRCQGWVSEKHRAQLAKANIMAAWSGLCWSCPGCHRSPSCPGEQRQGVKARYPLAPAFVSPCAICFLAISNTCVKLGYNSGANSIAMIHLGDHRHTERCPRLPSPCRLRKKAILSPLFCPLAFITQQHKNLENSGN